MEIEFCIYKLNYLYLQHSPRPHVCDRNEGKKLNSENEFIQIWDIETKVKIQIRYLLVSPAMHLHRKNGIARATIFELFTSIIN